MPIRMHCPDCRQALAIPSKFRGQRVDCPKCGKPFVVDQGAEDDSGSHDDLLVEGPGTNGVGAAGGGTLRLAETKGAVASRGKGAVSLTSRKVQFITEEPAETQLRLGRDGQLPDLALSDSELHREDEAQEKTSNPALLVSMLAISFMMSLLLLFVEFEGEGAGDLSADRARELVALEFFQEGPAEGKLATYQLYLRRAQQAYAKGDLDAERMWYRRALTLHHAETAKSYDTVTGSRDRDERLQDLLSKIMQAPLY